MLFLLLQRETFLSCLATECVGVLELQYPQYNTIMSEKKSKGGKSKAKNNRRWTDLELYCFADLLEKIKKSVIGLPLPLYN